MWSMISEGSSRGHTHTHTHTHTYTWINHMEKWVGQPVGSVVQLCQELSGSVLFCSSRSCRTIHHLNSRLTFAAQTLAVIHTCKFRGIALSLRPASALFHLSYPQMQWPWESDEGGSCVSTFIKKIKSGKDGEMRYFSLEIFIKTVLSFFFFLNTWGEVKLQVGFKMSTESFSRCDITDSGVAKGCLKDLRREQRSNSFLPTDWLLIYP